MIDLAINTLVKGHHEWQKLEYHQDKSQVI
jgi:hypothetical protein